MKSKALDASLIAHSAHSVQLVMLKVILALLPGTAVYFCLINTQIIINICVACTSAAIVEALLLYLRKRAVLRSLSDASIILAAWLLALCLPPTLPYWQLITGVIIMCTIGKHVFGGLGHNPFNPAMVAYAVMIISFPVQMTHWQTNSGFFRSEPAEKTVQMSDSADSERWDNLARATPLDRLREIKISPGGPTENVARTNATQLYDFDTSVLFFKSDWFLLNLAWLAGGIILILTRTITWHIPIAVLLSLGTAYAVYAIWSPPYILSPTTALFSGAIIFGAFFIATDPVSSATSASGKLIYGAGIGLLCFFVREFSVYPEGFAFAVLLMNICVPLIDYCVTRDKLSANSSAK